SSAAHSRSTGRPDGRNPHFKVVHPWALASQDRAPGFKHHRRNSPWLSKVTGRGASTDVLQRTRGPGAKVSEKTVSPDPSKELRVCCSCLVYDAKRRLSGRWSVPVPSVLGRRFTPPWNRKVGSRSFSFRRFRSVPPT